MRSLATLALLLSLPLIGCTSNHVKLDRAATAVGQSKARVVLPAWPTECRRHEVHAALVLGQDALSALKREREALNRQNARTDLCAGFYDDLAGRLK
jgi:phosphoenolpyruvate carboxylase